MEVVLLVLVVVGRPLLVLAALTLFGYGGGRLDKAVMGRRQGVEEQDPEPISGLRSSTRDARALRDRPDIDQSWTAWQRRDRRS